MNHKEYGTHSVKTFNANIKQLPIVANLVGKLPKHLISSQTVAGRELWAMPLNAADMATAKAAMPDSLPSYLPDFMDGRLKQVLLPYKNDYLAAAPVPSAKVHFEFFCALENQAYRSWLLQPVVAAWSSHGENVLSQRGRLRLFLTRIRKPVTPFSLPENAVCVSFYCEQMNIAGGMAAVGVPAITTVGGLVHAIERQFGAEIRFAVGFESITWHSPARGTNYQKVAASNNRTSPRIVTDEIIGTGKVHLILKSDKIGLAEYLKDNPFNRFAGGTVWDFSVQVGGQIQATFLCDNSKQLIEIQEENDILTAAVNLYNAEDTWGDTPDLFDTYSINHIGYGLLEKPIPRAKARNGYLSAWAEPLFGAVVLTDAPQNPFWQRVEYDGAVIWEHEQ